MRKIFAPLIAIAGGLLVVLAAENLLDALLAQILTLVFAIVVVMWLGVNLRREKQMPLLCDPFFVMCLFFAQFFVIGPIAMYGLGFRLETLFFRPFDPRLALYALGAFLLMLAMAIVGNLTPLGAIMAKGLPDFRFGRRKLPGRWIEVVLVVGGIVGCLGWIAFQGGLAAKLSAVYGRGRGGGAMFRIAHVSLLVGTLLMAWRVVSSASSRTVSWVVFAGLLLFDFVFFGIVYGARKYLFYFFFGLLAIWLLRKGTASLPKVRVAVVLALLLAFFSIWGTLRTRPVTALMGMEGDAAYNETAELHRGYFSGVSGPFGIACMVWEIFPEQEQFRHGRTLLVTVLGFIPRAVWPEKPIGIGKELTRYLLGPLYKEGGGWSVAPTVLGDFYINFGWLGVIVGGFVLGLLCRTTTVYAVDGMQGGLQLRAARVLIPAAFVMLLAEVRSDMATWLAFSVLTYIPLLFALTFFNVDAEDAGAVSTGAPMRRR